MEMATGMNLKAISMMSMEVEPTCPGTKFMPPRLIKMPLIVIKMKQDSPAGLS